MARRNATIARRLPSFLACATIFAFITLVALPPSVSAAGAPSVLKEAENDANEAASTATDAFKEATDVAGSAVEEAEIDAEESAEDAAEEAESATENLNEEKQELFKEAKSKASAAAGSTAKKGHKLCKWSWAEKRCTPPDLCQYKYQFLDAIPSESCRLKVFSTEKKVFKNPDIEIEPAYALAGAGGLFAADLLAIRFTDWLQRAPLLFNVVQGFVLFVSGDVLFQVLEQGWKKVVGVKWWRAARSGLIGALNNGLVHYTYYKWIDRRFPYDRFTEKRFGSPDGARSKLAIGLTKWAIEWPTIGLYKIASMYLLTAAMSGCMDTVLDRMKNSLLLTQLRGLQVWPIYDMILYAYVPTAHRPLFNSFMSILWGGYLSHVSQPHEAEEGDIPEATS